MAFAGDVCEQVGDIAKVWLLGADAAMKRYIVGRHCRHLQRCETLVRSVSDVDLSNAKGQCLQRNGVLENDTKGAC